MSISQFIKALSPAEENGLNYLCLFRHAFFYDFLELLFLPTLDSDLNTEDFSSLIDKAFSYGLMHPLFPDDPEGIILVNPLFSIWLERNYTITTDIEASYISYYEALDEYLFDKSIDSSVETYLDNLFWVEVEYSNLLKAAMLIMDKLKRFPSFNEGLLKMLYNTGQTGKYIWYLNYCKSYFKPVIGNQYALYCYCKLSLKEGLIYKTLGELEKGAQILEQTLREAEGLKGSKYYESIRQPVQFSLKNPYQELESGNSEIKEAEILKKINNSKGLATKEKGNLYQELGILYWHLDKTQDAKTAMENALNCYKSVEEVESMGNTLVGIGLILEEEEAYAEALNSFEKAYDYFLQVENQALAGRALISTARMHSHLKEFEMAESCIKEAIICCEQGHSKEGLIAAFEEMAWLQNTLQNQIDSAAYFLKALATGIENGRGLNELKMTIDFLEYPVKEGNLDAAYYEQKVMELLLNKYSRSKIISFFESN